jgi:hypothetical protein
MTKNITYFEGGHQFDTYKFKIREVVKVLVKKDGKPHKVVVFNQGSGKIMGRTSLY